MSSKEEILARIRQNTGTRYEKPDIAAMKRLAYPDKIEQFCAVAVRWAVRLSCWEKEKM